MSNITFSTAIFVNFTNANKFLCHRVESSKSAASQEDQIEIMGNAPVKEVAQAAGTTSTTGEKPKCKACCACPETKKIRDQCIMERGEENCGTLIEAHKQCMRDLGFNV